MPFGGEYAKPLYFLLAVDAATYSAPSDKSITVACIFNDQCIRSDANWISMPMPLRRLSVQPGQSLSTNASKRADACDASFV